MELPSLVTLIVAQFDIPGDGKDWRSDYRKGITLHKVFIGNKIYALRIVPAQQVVYIKAPGGVHEFICFQVPFDIK